jgi:hypothetical protein
MSQLERLVAVISPWDNLSAVVKKNFRVESLPEEKKVMVWRDDLQTEQALATELKSLGVAAVEVRKKNVTAKWQDVQ